MVVLCIIAGALFIYSAALTVRSWKQTEHLSGVLEIAPSTEEGEAPYIFLNMDTSPDKFQNGEYVTFQVHRIKPRN